MKLIKLQYRLDTAGHIRTTTESGHPSTLDWNN